MNNRQAGAYRELVRKEERAREKWAEANLGYSTQRLSGSNPSFDNNNNNINAYPPSSNAFSTTAPLPSSSSVSASIPPPPASGIYQQAIRVSSPRLVEDLTSNIPNTVQKRVVRQVELPYVRQVKVPVKTRKIIPVVVQKKVKTKKLLEVPSWTTVDEEYTDVVEVPAVRQKEIWVKKIVPEKYLKKVEVKKQRKVKVPTTLLKEVDDYELVNVTENRAVEVDGYRVDEVEDSKLVEVEEFQTYQLKPFPTGQSEVVNARDIGPVRGFHHSRRIGAEVFHPADERHRSIDEDPSPDDLQRTSLRGNTSTVIASNNGSLSARPAPRSTRPTANNPSSSSLSSALQSNDDSSLSSTASDDAASAFTSKIGFRVRNSHANGVIVYRVQSGEAAERAGLQVSDIIIYANNKPTRNLTEFRSVVHNTSGPIYLQVLRRGAKKLLLTVHR